jgi:hypothetical protein
VITIFVPDIVETGTFEVHAVVNGNPTTVNYQPRPWRGFRVLDCPPAFFRSLLAGPSGLLWQQANPEALAWIGAQEGRNEYGGTPFPGESRAERVAAVAVDASPVMVRLRAPTGCSGVSAEGSSIEIGADGCVTVTERIAQDLRHHGFTDA